MFVESILHPWGEYHFFMIFHFHLFLNMICSNFIGIFLSKFRDILRGGIVSLSLHVGLRSVRVECLSRRQGCSISCPTSVCISQLSRSRATGLLCVGRQHLLSIFPEFVNFLYSFPLWNKACCFLAYLILFFKWR